MLLMYASNKGGFAAVVPQKLPIPTSLDNRRCLTLQRLVDASERQLEHLAHRGSSEEARVAQRVLECPVVFQQWEREHVQIMRNVAVASTRLEQKHRLLATALSLLHRKGLFEYLRSHRVRDHQRELLLMHFHGGNDYARAMVIEHGNYVRSAASYECAAFVGLQLLHDAQFASPLDEYTMLYASYFATYSELLLSKTAAGSDLGMAVYRLKCQLGQRRRSLLNIAQSLN